MLKTIDVVLSSGRVHKIAVAEVARDLQLEKARDLKAGMVYFDQFEIIEWLHAHLQRFGVHVEEKQVLRYRGHW